MLTIFSNMKGKFEYIEKETNSKHIWKRFTIEFLKNVL